MPAKGNIVFFEKLIKQFGSTFCLWFGPKLYVFVCNSEDIELVLTSPECINRPEIFTNAVRDAFDGDGLFTSESWLIIQ